MSCSCHTDSGSTILKGLGRVSVGGSGTASDPYVISESDDSASLALEVRDTGTLNLTLFGSGTQADPYILRGDTSSAASLRSLGDVSPTPQVAQGAVPLWIGSPAGGHFELRTPGVRYTTNATRGSGLYQGEVIRETDTGKRLEWDGSQWIDLTPAYVPPSALDPTVLQSGGTLDQNSVDWNTLTTQSRIYRVGNPPANVNFPAGAYNFGTLVVIVSGQSVTQTYHSHRGLIYERTKWNASDWSAWTRAFTADDASTMNTTLTGLITQLRTDATNGDNGLRSALNSEISQRGSSDSYLGGRIDNIVGDRSLDSRYYTQSAINSAFSQRDSRLNALEATGGQSFTVAGGWTVGRANVWVRGSITQLDISLRRTGGTVTAGNISNLQVGTVASGYGCNGFAGLVSGPGGSVASGYISGTGVYLASTTAQINNGDELTLCGTWIRS